MAWLKESTARQTFGPGLVRVEAAFEVIVFGVAMGGVESGTHRGCCCPGFRAGLMGRAFSDADGPQFATSRHRQPDIRAQVLPRGKSGRPLCG